MRTRNATDREANRAYGTYTARRSAGGSSPNSSYCTSGAMPTIVRRTTPVRSRTVRVCPSGSPPSTRARASDALTIATGASGSPNSPRDSSRPRRRPPPIAANAPSLTPTSVAGSSSSARAAASRTTATCGPPSSAGIAVVTAVDVTDGRARSASSRRASACALALVGSTASPAR